MSALGRLYRGENNINFEKWWRRGLVFSSILVVVSLLSLFTRGLNLGIDFEGGVSWEVNAPGVSVSATRDTLGPIGLGDAKIQIVGSDTLRVQGPADDQEKQDQVRQSLADLASTSTAEVTVSTVGPSWGNEITKSAERALIIFLLAILLYLTIRLEWQMAVGAVVAVVHDIIISVGVYSIFQIEVTPATVIAFLTILGYSIYDTVVVFDKAKENETRVGLAGRLTYTDMMSLSMNQVLLRSINTSVVALIPVLSLLIVGAVILGAVTIEEFSTALAIGMTAGTYSSVFIAAPMVVWFRERDQKYRAIRQRVEARTATSAGLDDQFVDAEVIERGDEGSEPAARQGESPARRTGPKPGVTPTGVIPPRPRKKGKKR